MPVFRLLVFFSVLIWAGSGLAELVDRVVAIVNDEVITLSELEDAVSPYLREVETSAYGPEKKREMVFKIRQETLERMIERKLTEQQGEASGVSVSDREVDRQIERLKEEEFLTDEALREVLEREGYTLEEYKKRLKNQLLGIKLINKEVKSKVAITDDEIEAYYREHEAEYGQETQYHLRTILVRVDSWADTPEKAAAQKKIEEIAIKLRAGVSFEALARQYSEDITAKDGGDIGWFSIDELTQELQETVRWMDVGAVSPVLQTEQGYQILKLEQMRGKKGKTLEEAKEEIQEKIYQEMVEQRYEAWLEDIREDAYIKIIQ
jgi:peptidyl-prolyl cis-trans isomerase SurA